ncbi:MAG: hypothetical protein ACYDC8_16005 [Gammaproteobacteria bacterium]
MPEKNTMLLIYTFLGGAILASAITYYSTGATAAVRLFSAMDPEIARLGTKLDRLEAKVDSLRMEISTPTRISSGPNSGGAGTHDIVTGSTVGQTANAEKNENSIALSENQKALYDRLSQSVEYASNGGGGFTMAQLVEQMSELPKEYQDKLIGQVATRINSQTLAPQLFMEGKK